MPSPSHSEVSELVRCARITPWLTGAYSWQRGQRASSPASIFRCNSASSRSLQRGECRLLLPLRLLAGLPQLVGISGPDRSCFSWSGMREGAWRAGRCRHTTFGVSLALALWVPINHPCWSGSMPVLVEDAAEPVPSADVEVRDLLRIGNRFG